MGQGAENILFPKAPIEGNRFGEMSDIGFGAFREASAARNWSMWIHLPSHCGAKRGGSHARMCLASVPRAYPGLWQDRKRPVNLVLIMLPNCSGLDFLLALGRQYLPLLEARQDFLFFEGVIRRK